MDKFPISETAYAEFARVVCKYQEARYGSGDLAAMLYEQGGGKATNTGSSQTVKPSLSDMVADVDIAARRSLAPGEVAYWKTYYESGLVVVESPESMGDGKDVSLEKHIASFTKSKRNAVRSLDFKVRYKVGCRLVYSGVSPIDVYMKPVDVRVPRKPKQKWSHLY